MSRKNTKKTFILQFTLDGEYVNYFQSTFEAARELNDPSLAKNIPRMVRYGSKLHQIGGFLWAEVSYEKLPMKTDTDGGGLTTIGQLQMVAMGKAQIQPHILFNLMKQIDLNKIPVEDVEQIIKLLLIHKPK